jgi:hypothetical protein
MLCAVYTVHKDTRSMSFLVEPQNQSRRVSRFEPQNRQLRFGDLGSKIIATVSWFGPQNQDGNGLSVVPQNRRDKDGPGHTLRSSYLLHREVSRVRIFQSTSKLTEERQRVVLMATPWRSHEDEVKDRCVDAMDYIRLLYPNSTVFIVLGLRGILVF